MELNEELINKFAEEIEDGLPLIYTCDLFGISWQTFNNWMKQGESDRDHEVNSLTSKFFRSIKKAYAKFIKKTKQKIYNGELGWQGSAWWLERTNKNFVLNTEDGSSVEPVIVNAGVSKNGTKCK